MDDALYTEDLDLASVTTHRDLAVLLQTVHLRADKPSLRTLEARTRHDEAPLSKTVVAEMLKGVRFPRKAVMTGFLRACGVRGDHLAPWLRAWERIAVQEDPATRRISANAVSADRRSDRLGRERSATADPELEELRSQVSRLNADNDRLRLQVNDLRRPRVEQEPSSAHSGNAPVLHSPVARRRELGVLLHAIREEKGLTIEQVAEHLMCTVNKVKRMEASFRAGTLRDVRDLCNLYGVVDEAERDRIMNLAIEGKQQGWWQSYHLGYGTYVGLETEAVSISAFQSSVVHGLLQTADYAREGHETAMPRLSPDEIDMQIEAKLTRQRILTRDEPPRVTVVLDEAALHRAVGGNLVMAAQLTKILDLSALPNVMVQVLPFKLGAHPALESNFTILGLPNSPEIVFVEGLIGSTYLEREEDLKRYREIFSRLKSIALSPENTANLLADFRDSYRDDYQIPLSASAGYP